MLNNYNLFIQKQQTKMYAVVNDCFDKSGQLVPSDSCELSLESCLADSQVPSPSVAWASYWAEGHGSPLALYSARTPSPDASCQPPSSPQSGISAEPSSLDELLHLDFDCFGATFGLNGHKEVVGRPIEGNKLLRRVLQEESSHQEPYNWQLANDLASVIVSSSSSNLMGSPADCATDAAGSSTGNAPGLASVLAMVMEQVNDEVRSTCDNLGISPNPSDWSVDDVKAWMLWTSRQCGVSNVPLDRFVMNGPTLSSLSADDFRQKLPQGGDILYAKLDIWRSAWQQQQQQPAWEPVAPKQQPQIPTIQVDEAIPDISEVLAWLNNTQDVQHPSMLSTSPLPGQSHLAAPSPVSSLMVGSPYSECDLTPSESETNAEETMSEGDMEDEEMSTGDSNTGRTSQVSQGSQGGSHIHLWQFLKELLSNPQQNGSAIRWLDRQKGIFKIEDSVRVARLWGKRKNRPAMNYDKLSRSIRQYYRKGIMKKTERSQRLVYQFCHPYYL